MENSDDIVKEFLAESQENLDRLDRDLVELEKHPSDHDTLASIFRTIHTIKGTCGFLGFAKLEAVTHVGESLLARLRDGQLKLNPIRTTALLAMVDAVREMLASIGAAGNEGERNDQKLLTTLTNLLAPDTQASVSAGETLQTNPTQPKPMDQANGPVAQAANASQVVESPLPTEVDFLEPADRPNVEDASASDADTAEKQREKPPEPEEPLARQQRARSDVGQNTVRVSVMLLDQLMNLVGELVLARNQILQFTRNNEETKLMTTGQRLNLIATELQESVMKTRMQPIGSIWSRFPRTVRDLAMACGKQVRIEMEGQATELDRTLIEAIKDPMTHLVRNAVDHGIECSEIRASAGKGPEGVLRLRAYHEGGQVNIEISDDGAGLDVKKIVEKAVKKGLITGAQSLQLSDREAANLIFLPGLSTAEKVTNVSGRGVGMDVVKTNIERIGGTVDVQSFAGAGTTVRLKIPLTLAIVPALIVTAAEQRFAIPQASLLELVGLGAGEARQRIEMVQGAAVYRLRGNLLPLVELKAALRIEDKRNIEEKRIGGECVPLQGTPEMIAKSEIQSVPSSVNIVVLQADSDRFGLLVDEISDTEEIVVKPLSKHLKNLNVFAGATIMGDGKVALILDVLSLAQQAHVIGKIEEGAVAETEARTAHSVSQDKRCRPVLLFQLADGATMAIDLGSVARLEEFSPESIEIVGALETVQYRGEIMPLIRLSRELAQRQPVASKANARLQVIVVYAGNARSVGLVVEKILDIVDEPFVLDEQTARPGVVGSAVIQQRITDIVDVSGVLASIPVMEKKSAAHA
jgi:two-component system, chemotaxis family, sensor kinase CheA